MLFLLFSTFPLQYSFKVSAKENTQKVHFGVKKSKKKCPVIGEFTVQLNHLTILSFIFTNHLLVIESKFKRNGFNGLIKILQIYQSYKIWFQNDQLSNQNIGFSMCTHYPSIMSIIPEYGVEQIKSGGRAIKR